MIKIDGIHIGAVLDGQLVDGVGDVVAIAVLDFELAEDQLVPQCTRRQF